MDVTPVAEKGLALVSAYGNGGFRLGETFHEGPILMLPGGAQPWHVRDIKTCGIQDYNWLSKLEPKPEFLIIGTGKMHALLPPEVRQHIRGQRISVDSMDTGAACRTYNVLATEGRRVAAALIAID